MSNPDPNGEVLRDGEQRDLHLIKGEGNNGPEGPFFNQYWGPPQDIDELADSVSRISRDNPTAVVLTVINATFPYELTENNIFQEELHAEIASAGRYYTEVVWPKYPKETADLDRVTQLFDATEEYHNSTLLHTIRVLQENPKIGRDMLKDAERISQILILQECDPEALVIPR